jgi:hypothetical protein
MSEDPDAPFKKPVFGGTQMSERTPVQQEYSGPRDLTGVLGDAPPGAWVALSRDETRILGTGDSMRAAALQAQLKGECNPVLIKMPLESEGLAAGVR